MIAERGFNQIWFSIECNDVSDKWKTSVIGILQTLDSHFNENKDSVTTLWTSSLELALFQI